MTSNQPYLLRAFYDWIVDNQLTPYIVVNALDERVEVPQEFVQGGQIVLNVSPAACVNFALDLEYLSFQARFGGVPRQLSMPCSAVMAIYARENGAGTVFATEEELSEGARRKESPETSSDSTQDADTPLSDKAPSGDNNTPPKKGKPNLKIIK